jgi:hypothetical protein
MLSSTEVFPNSQARLRKGARVCNPCGGIDGAEQFEFQEATVSRRLFTNIIWHVLGA